MSVTVHGKGAATSKIFFGKNELYLMVQKWTQFLAIKRTS